MSGIDDTAMRQLPGWVKVLNEDKSFDKYEKTDDDWHLETKQIMGSWWRTTVTDVITGSEVFTEDAPHPVSASRRGELAVWHQAKRWKDERNGS